SSDVCSSDLATTSGSQAGSKSTCVQPGKRTPPEPRAILAYGSEAAWFMRGGSVGWRLAIIAQAIGMLGKPAVRGKNGRLHPAPIERGNPDHVPQPGRR